jgi:CDP-paratose 2-epimerase
MLAEPSVLAGYGGSPEYLVHTNLTGCFHCLELARQSKADFLFVSTSRVYPVAPLNALRFEGTDDALRAGVSASSPGASEFGISEAFPMAGARSLYGMTKLSAELMVAEYGDAYGIRFVIDRCGLLTGPWQMAKADQGVVAYWVAAHCLNRGLKYIGFGGTGKQVRDFLHIDDFLRPGVRPN